MSGEQPSVRRGGSDAAARVAATLNWLAIGGLVGAATTGVIAVRLPVQPAPASLEVAVHQAAAADSPMNLSSVGLSPTETGEVRSEVRAEAPDLAGVADGSAEPVPAREVDAAAAPKEKQRRSGQAAGRKPQEKGLEKAGEADPSPPAPTQEDVPAPVDTNTAWSESEVKAAREECTALMGKLAAEWSIAPPMRAMTCGAPGPITLNSVGAGAAKVALVPAATTNCSTAAALSRWMEQHVQPAALKHFGAPVARVTIATSYDCRNRYGQRQAPLSEHALANALDLSGFKLADGRMVNVLGGWGPTARNTQVAPAETAGAAKIEGKGAPVGQVRMGLGVQSAGGATASKAKAAPAAAGSSAAVKGPEAEFLRSVHASACTVFGTVLGPEANEAHRDHFHLDMKYRRRNSFCQ